MIALGYTFLDGTTMTTGPKYPNQQLRSVSLETHFPGELSYFGQLGVIQEQVRDRLPNLFVPNIQPGEAVALRPFQFRDQDRAALAIAVNQATYVSYAYPGHSAFVAEANPILRAALESVGPTLLSRVTYRYENEVGLERDGAGCVGVGDIFPGILLPALSVDLTRAVNLAVEHAWVEGDRGGIRGVHARIEEGLAGPVLRVAVLASVEAVQLDDFEPAVSKAHELAFNLFESLISDDFREFISNGSEEG